MKSNVPEEFTKLRGVSPLIIVGIIWDSGIEYYSNCEHSIVVDDITYPIYNVIESFENLEILNKVDSVFQNNNVTINFIDQFGIFKNRLDTDIIYGLKCEVRVGEKNTTETILMFTGEIDDSITYDLDTKIMSLNINTSVTGTRDFGYSVDISTSNMEFLLDSSSIYYQVQQRLTTEIWPQCYGFLYNFKPLKLLSSLNIEIAQITTSATYVADTVDEELIEDPGGFYYFRLRTTDVDSWTVNLGYYEARIIGDQNGPYVIRCKGKLVNVKEGDNTYFYFKVPLTSTPVVRYELDDEGTTLWSTTYIWHEDFVDATYTYGDPNGYSSATFKRIDAGRDGDYLILKYNSVAKPNIQFSYCMLRDSDGNEFLTKCFKQVGDYCYFTEIASTARFTDIESPGLGCLVWSSKYLDGLYSIEKGAKLDIIDLYTTPAGRDLSNIYIIDAIDVADKKYNDIKVKFMFPSDFKLEEDGAITKMDYTDIAIDKNNYSIIYTTGEDDNRLIDIDLEPCVYLHLHNTFFLRAFPEYIEDRLDIQPSIDMNVVMYNNNQIKLKNVVNSILVNYSNSTKSVDMDNCDDLMLLEDDMPYADIFNPNLTDATYYYLNSQTTIESLISDLAWQHYAYAICIGDSVILKSKLKLKYDNPIKVIGPTELDSNYPITLSVKSSNEIINSIKLNCTTNNYDDKPISITMVEREKIRTVKRQEYNYYCWFGYVQAKWLAATYASQLATPWYYLSFTTYIDNIALEIYDRISVNLELKYYNQLLGTPFNNLLSQTGIEVNQNKTVTGYITSINYRISEGLIDITIELDNYLGGGDWDDEES